MYLVVSKMVDSTNSEIECKLMVRAQELLRQVTVKNYRLL